MKTRTELPDPFEVVAKALGCPTMSISLDSAMYRDHGWDSFGHVRVIIALEEAYGIRLDDQTVQMLATMKEIQQLFDRIRGGQTDR